MACKRKSLRIDEKVSLIRAIESGEKITHAGRRFGLSHSTVSTIWKNKKKFLQAEDDRKSCKKLKKPKYEDLDQVMLSWCRRQSLNNMPVSGPIVKAKAERFSEELGLTAFKASEGWLGKFKQRHHINLRNINSRVDTNAVQQPTTEGPSSTTTLRAKKKPPPSSAARQGESPHDNDYEAGTSSRPDVNDEDSNSTSTKSGAGNG